MGADKATGRGAPQLGDLRLLQDGDEREGTLAVDIVLVETAIRMREGRSRNGVREKACQRALTQRRTLGVWQRTPTRSQSSP